MTTDDEAVSEDQAAARGVAKRAAWEKDGPSVVRRAPAGSVAEMHWTHGLGFDAGYEAAEDRALAAEAALRLVRADVKNAMNGYGDDCLRRALGCIDDALTAAARLVGEGKGT